MAKNIKSGSRLPSPKAKKSVKRRNVSAGDDYVPTSPKRLYHPPADPTFRPKHGSDQLSPVITDRKSRITKARPGKPKKRVVTPQSYIKHKEAVKTDTSVPAFTIRPRSNVGSSSSPSATARPSVSKNVRFDPKASHCSCSEDEGYEPPLVDIFSSNKLSSATGLRTPPKTPSRSSSVNTHEKPGPAYKTALSQGDPEPVAPVKPSHPTETRPTADFSWKELDAKSGELLEDLLQNPRAISLNDISACFYHLQAWTRGWAEAHFSFELDSSKAVLDAWPLHLLRTKYYPLFLTTQYIADGSQYGWKRFFTNPDSRSCLVYGIVGEYVKHHIFGHTAFGFTKEENAELEKADKRELHQDAFLRTKARAKLMESMFEDMSLADRDDEASRQVDDLVDGLLQVIEPLMPREVFDYNVRKKQWYVKDDTTSHRIKDLIRKQLARIIHKCVALHWGIRLAGAEGCVIRIANHVSKGQQFHDNAPFVCLNKAMLERTKHHGGPDGVRKIKLTCWGRVEATIPHGKDYNELVEIEAQYREAHGMTLDADQGERSETDNFDWDAVDKWYYTYNQKHLQPEYPESVKHREMRERGLSEESAETMRGPYVQLHPIMTNHDVYCEWEPAEKPEFNFNSRIEEVPDPRPPKGTNFGQVAADKKYGLPIPKGERLSLRQAIEQDRKEKHIWKHLVEDTSMRTWKHLNDNWWKYESSAYLFMGLMVAKEVKGYSWAQIWKTSKASLRAITKQVESQQRIVDGFWTIVRKLNRYQGHQHGAPTRTTWRRVKKSS